MPPATKASTAKKQAQATKVARGKRAADVRSTARAAGELGLADLEIIKELDRRITNGESVDDVLDEGNAAARAAPAAMMHPTQSFAAPEANNVDPRLQNDNWQSAQAAAGNDIAQGHGGSNESAEMPSWQRNALEVENRRTQSKQQQNDTRRFLDRQPNAQRVEFGEDFGPSQAITVGSSLGKRPYREDEAEDDEGDQSQDGGFQEDTRDIAIAANRQIDSSSNANSLAAPSSNREPFNSGTNHYGNQPDLNSADPKGVEGLRGYAQVKELAKTSRKTHAITSQAEAGLPPIGSSTMMQDRRHMGKQAKRTWNADEEQALIDAIARYGCSWSEIKRQDSSMGESKAKLGRWSQVDLKDKAIGIKTHYLQSRLALPQNFDMVSLRKRDKDRLENMRISTDG